MNPGSANVLAGASAGVDHQLRILVDFNGAGQTLYALDSTGHLVRSAAQPVGWLAAGLGVGGDNRSHLLK